MRLLRIVSLVVVAILSLTLLMRISPGYFSDSRELDAVHGAVARQQRDEVLRQEASLPISLKKQWQALTHGDLGSSRQYGVPVSSLIAERAGVSARLLGASVLCAWILSLGCALPLALRRSSRGETLAALPIAILLCVPAGAMATFCMVSGVGGPLLVLTLILAARDFKIFHRLLRKLVWSPDVLLARSQGLASRSIVANYLLPTAAPELLALALTSLALALSACVPIEVIFDVPGLGQLAWAAAINRDLPVLTAVTILMAGCIGLATMGHDLYSREESAVCV